MKKTVSVNIKGINFLMEEDAFETLQNYLDRLKSSLNNQEGAEEICEDIEIRIAELCSKQLDEKKQVIELEDIQAILAALGDPSQFVEDDEEDASHKSSYDQKNEKNEFNKKMFEKRLYRDSENAQIAGVCQGIANYFKIDVVIIRIIWALIFFFGGFGLLLYIILWIVIPKANTSIDRLRMKGKPITVENVREEVEQAAEKISKNTKKFAATLQNEDTYSKHIHFIGRIVTVCFGLLSIFIGLGFLISFLVFVIGGFQFIPAKTDSGFLSLSQIGELVLPTSGDVGTAWIGGLLLSISVILFFFLFGFYILFRLKNKWSKLSLLGLVLTAITGGIICIYLGVKTGRDTTITGEIERTIGSVYTEQLHIISESQHLNNDSTVKIKSNNQQWLTEIKDGKVYESDIRYIYKTSNDSLYHIYEVSKSNAHTLAAAVNRAKNIKHNISMVGDSLIVGDAFSYPTKDKFRLQRLKVIIEVPKNKTVLFDGEQVELELN